MPLKIIDNEKIRDIIGTLKNINIKDLQNIDARDVVNILRQRLAIVVNAVLVVVTIAVMANVVKSYGKKSQTLAGEIKQKEEKLEVAREADRLAKEHAAFLANFPAPVAADQLIKKLSEFAAARKVQILSFSPAPVKERGDDYISVAEVQVNVSSDTYRNIVLFMRDIEDSPYALVVGKWSAGMDEKKVKEGAGEIRTQTVKADMSVNSIRVKDVEKDAKKK